MERAACDAAFLSKELDIAEETELSQVLPKGVSKVIIMDGVAYVDVDASVTMDELSLVSTGNVSNFEPLPEMALTELNVQHDRLFDLGSKPFFSVANAISPKPCNANLNKMKDWILHGSQTLQIEVLETEAPFRIDIVPTMELPARVGGLVFKALLASHRANGTFILTVAGATTGTVQTFEQAFDPTKLGGLAAELYSPVEFVLPRSTEKQILSMSVEFEVSTNVKDRPWLFIARPLVAHAANKKSAEARVEIGNPQQPEGGNWFFAPVPTTLLGDETVMLTVGDERVTLVSKESVEIALVEEFGHSISFKASVPGLYHLRIDAEKPLAVTLRSDPTHVRMPNSAMSGETRLVQITDTSGVKVYLQQYVLMPRLLTPLDVMQSESARPFSGGLSPQASRRYDSLKAQMSAGHDPETIKQIATALDALEGGHTNAKLQPLKFPHVENPDVSIIIPAHNKIAVTMIGLCSLLLAFNKATYEVILVDDASTDDTATIEEHVSGITVVRNAQAQRFIRACNAGVAKSRGTYVALLNNDVEVTTGWLDALIDAFRRFPNVGLAGSKLLYPNGKLQDAGGIVWGSGNPWNYGNRQNPWEPRFCYARQADYLSGAALMTTREIWDRVGGLSTYLEPMYFEDTDFAFKVREAGYTTWFVPDSVVFHYEGMTSGSDTSSGYKRFQEVNRPKFKRRWAKDFARFGEEGKRADFEKDRGVVGRVLFIDYALPRPDRDAGSYAAIKEIELVQSLGYKVTFLPRNLANLGSYTDDLQRRGVEVISAPFFLSIKDYLDAYGKDFDAVYITRYNVAQDVLDTIRTLAPQAKVMFNNADLHFLRELRSGLAAKDKNQIANSARTREMELTVLRGSDVILSYNEVEHAVITAHIEGAVPVVKCPWVVDLSGNPPPLPDRSGLSFLGSFRHHPNAEGVKWFVRSVLPLVQSTFPDLNFHIYGSGISKEIEDLSTDRILAHGFVEDIAEAFDPHRIFVAPLLSGAGIKGKVLSALAHGIPCVLTPVAAEGIGLRHGHDCFVATQPKDWATAISTLLRDDTVWQKTADNARAYVAEAYSFEKGRMLMREAFEAVELYQSLP